jgi:hypothetical protein
VICLAAGDFELQRKNNMPKLAVLGAAAMLCIATVPPAMAWEANPEPGYCAQFYPNRDCNSLEPDPPGRGASRKAPATAPNPETAAKNKKRQPASVETRAKRP